MPRLIFTACVTTVFVLLCFAIPIRPLTGISSVRLGMNQEEVFRRMGFPEIYGDQTDNNWYFFKYGPFIFGVLDIKIDMHGYGAVNQYGRSGDHVTAILWKRTFCLDTEENIHLLIR